MYSIQHLKEGYRIFKRSRHVKKHGFKKYEGNLEEICTKIVKECWNGTFFQTSAGHFSVYYIRDFCICIPGLIKLGYRKEILKTLQYALNLFSNNRKITTTISKENIPVHMHHYSPDSLPLLLKSLRLAKANELMEMMQEENLGYLAVSLGFYKTLFSAPGSSTSSEIPEDEQSEMGLTDGLIRFSIGLDNDIELTFKRMVACMKKLHIL